MKEMPSHEEKVVDQFSQQAESYRHLTQSLSSTDRQATFRAQVGASSADIVLDVCCGPGTMALDLAPFVTKVTGIDLTPAMLEQARAVQTIRELTNVDFAIGDISAIPFADGAFSLVVCGAAFHHLADPRGAFAELVRVCRPGGRIAVRDVTPSREKSAAFDELEIMRDPSHFHALTRDEMADLGNAQPVEAPVLYPSVTADLPLASILATSFPELCSIDHIHALLREDAETEVDRWGFAAKIADGVVRVSYAQTTAVWIRK
jgi:ubiquinone/menaquinone biosynthesis C-methylase UbiE